MVNDIFSGRTLYFEGRIWQVFALTSARAAQSGGGDARRARRVVLYRPCASGLDRQHFLMLRLSEVRHALITGRAAFILRSRPFGGLAVVRPSPSSGHPPLFTATGGAGGVKDAGWSKAPRR